MVFSFYFQQLLLLLTLPFALSASTLQDRLKGASPGDYVVTEANQTVTLLLIRSIEKESIRIEEISAPRSQIPQESLRWRDWVEQKAPGHSSWSLITLDLRNGEILNCYSFSRNAWLAITDRESLFATLLQLPLTPLPSSERRKIGPPPQPGEADVRQIWNPPLVFEGEKLPHTHCMAYETKWPADRGELANKRVTLYFDEKREFPFPYWIQIDTPHLIGHLRVIDSGHQLQSPQKLVRFLTN